MVEDRWLDGRQQTIHTIAFDYDPLGRMVEGSDSFANCAFTIDPLGRVTEIQGGPGMPLVVLQQQFDAVGNRTRLSASINGTADFADSFEFDSLSRMTRVRQTRQTGGNVVGDKRVDVHYNAVGQFTSINRFADVNGTQLVVDCDFLYDHAARLTDLRHRQGSTVLADYGWYYDAFSRVTSFLSQTDGSVTYSYDDTDQLTVADYSQMPDESFSYDLTGNRTMTGYVTGANNRLLSDGTFNYVYDDEGSRMSRTNIATGEVTEYSWDHRNRLVAIVEKDGQGQVTQSVSYSYDCFDRRIAKVITPVVGPSELEQYIYDGEHIALRFENGNLANRYLHGLLVDQILADEQLDIGTGQTDRLLWLLTDNLGSVRDMAEFDDVTGITAIVDHITYSAFGEILSNTNPSLDHLFGYTGRETDPESDLHFYRARYYDPLTGRFIGEDPIGFAAGDVNVHRYVGNGPTNASDPSGLDPPSSIISRLFPNELRIGYRLAEMYSRAVYGYGAQHVKSMGDPKSELAFDLGVASGSVFVKPLDYAWNRDEAAKRDVAGVASLLLPVPIDYEPEHALVSDYVFDVACEIDAESGPWGRDFAPIADDAILIVAGRIVGLRGTSLRPAPAVRSTPRGTNPRLAGVQANRLAGDATADAIATREAGLREGYFNTVGGVRRPDVISLGEEVVAIESKVGRTALDSRARQELARDWWLRRQGQVDRIRWEFSPNSAGDVGPTGPLLQKLHKLGFEVRINPANPTIH